MFVSGAEVKPNSWQFTVATLGGVHEVYASTSAHCQLSHCLDINHGVASSILFPSILSRLISFLSCYIIAGASLALSQRWELNICGLFALSGLAPSGINPSSFRFPRGFLESSTENFWSIETGWSKTCYITLGVWVFFLILCCIMIWWASSCVCIERRLCECSMVGHWSLASIRGGLLMMDR